jgi:hypothetical protein
MTGTDIETRPWIILVGHSDVLGEPIHAVSRIKGQLAHKPGRIRLFPTREAAEAYLATSVERRPRRTYVVTTLP